MSVIDHRRLALAAGAALLTLGGATGCASLDRTGLGTIAYETANKHLVQVDSPRVRGCHRFAAAGAVKVTNRTRVDLVMYPSDHCAGGNTVYIPTATADEVAPGAGVWRSYTLVH
ncbi:hypothetical protein [Streptomyces paludis]|uniref:Uncharacterized protein n=1 Tax=Streptomyces paludis TaxID=2282738 RepID=A0A345HKR6_9ACTN|nr:hypothetical protein [Streptomyces paludis]AXG77290.1 hypothetical protein DVK44_05845 [Streptomyces paludis]